MKRSITSLLIGALLLTACATTSSPKSAQTKAAKPTNIKEWVETQSRARQKAMVWGLVGALAGAASAGMTGKNPLEGAAAGFVVGAAAGYMVGKHQDRIFAERDLAVRQAGYDKAQGYVANIQEVSFNPPQPKPGQTATLYVRYMVIGPDPNEKIAVKMFRGLKYGDDYVLGAGPNEFDVPRGGGIVESTMPVTLPAKATQGTYSVEALIEDPKGRFPTSTGTGVVYVVATSARHPRAMVASR